MQMMKSVTMEIPTHEMAVLQPVKQKHVEMELWILVKNAMMIMSQMAMVVMIHVILNTVETELYKITQDMQKSVMMGTITTKTDAMNCVSQNTAEILLFKQISERYVMMEMLRMMMDVVVLVSQRYVEMEPSKTMHDMQNIVMMEILQQEMDVTQVVRLKCVAIILWISEKNVILM